MSRRPGDQSGSRGPSPRNTGPSSKKSNLRVQSHHRHGPHKPKIEPAPECMPDAARIPVTVRLKTWRHSITCSVVRVDQKTKQILLALPDDLSHTPLGDSGDQAVIGWPGHSVWHESKTSLAGKMKRGSRFFWLRITSGPVHHERRRFVRAKHVRPVAIHSGRDRVSATSMDISEAAMRVVIRLGEPIHAGDKVHMLFNTTHRFRGEVMPMAIDGHVYRTRELTEGQAGRKEVVVFFENLSPPQEDFIRGLVFDIDLQERRPALADD